MTETAAQLFTQRESRQICEDLAKEGISIAWHNFVLAGTGMLSDAYACPQGRLRLCLNLSGDGSLCYSDKKLPFGSLSGFVYVSGNSRLQAWRKPGERHRFLTIDFSSIFLRDQLGICEASLPATVRNFVRSGGALTGFESTISLTQEHERLIAILLRPQCLEGCCQLRCKGVALQLMAEFLMQPCCGDPSSCDRQKCLGLERAHKVIAILGRDLVEPPTLEEIGREIGCSPFYLSRIFSREMGMTIPQCLRMLRMRYAAELLGSGRCNVTEAAMAVGYSSLSHFSRVFCQALGCCPGAYSSSRHEQNTAACTDSRPDKNVFSSIVDQLAYRKLHSGIDVMLEAVGPA